MRKKNKQMSEEFWTDEERDIFRIIGKFANETIASFYKGDEKKCLTALTQVSLIILYANKKYLEQQRPEYGREFLEALIKTIQKQL